MSVFVDTSGLYALLVHTEARHGEIFRAFRKLLQEGRTLSTTGYRLLPPAQK